MQFHSTRGAQQVALEDAIMSGTAPDGGLYMPDNIAAIDRGVQIKMRDQNGDLKVLSEEETAIQRQKALDTAAVHCN